MKAIAIDQFGPVEELTYRELPDPVPGKGEVLIRVRAAGVNPVDRKVRDGLLRARVPHQFPVIPGFDVAGDVVALGPGCRRFKVGDAVFAYARKPVVKDGCYAELVTHTEKHTVMKPANLSYEEAASIPLAAVTAWQSLFDVGELRRGQTVLIQAGAGGVGGFAVQLARWKGAHVIATAGAANQDYVRGLGAHEVIDYTASDFVSEVRRHHPDGVDLALDAVGGEVQERSARAVKTGGILVSLLAYTREAELRALGIQTRYWFAQPNGRHLERIRALAERGVLKTHVSAVLPLREAAEAQRRIVTGHTRGKIVLVP